MGGKLSLGLLLQEWDTNSLGCHAPPGCHIIGQHRSIGAVVHTPGGDPILVCSTYLRTVEGLSEANVELLACIGTVVEQ
eukprot:6384268-Pyramimonas_sp.AAC.1